MASGQGSRLPAGAPSLPFPIFRASCRRPKYMLYDIDTVTWLRREHHILGVQIGGMPQFPQQNVFFGLPLELMPEEARLLVEQGLSYIVDDLETHDKIFTGLLKGDPKTVGAVRNYREEMAETARQSQDEHAKAKAAEAERARERQGMKRPEKVDCGSPAVWNAAKLPWIGSDEIVVDELYAALPVSDTKLVSAKQLATTSSWSSTPSTASALIQSAPASSNPHVYASPATYAIFKHLHAQGYFMSPGLRFGCQLMAYPGDPLRFHSHFLCTGADWDEEFDLLDLVGGGRLGTGVKKGYLLGGAQTVGEKEGQTRTFCIEWGGL